MVVRLDGKLQQSQVVHHQLLIAQQTAAQLIMGISTVKMQGGSSILVIFQQHVSSDVKAAARHGKGTGQRQHVQRVRNALRQGLIRLRIGRGIHGKVNIKAIANVCAFA